MQAGPLILMRSNAVNDLPKRGQERSTNGMHHQAGYGQERSEAVRLPNESGQGRSGCQGRPPFPLAACVSIAERFALTLEEPLQSTLIFDKSIVGEGYFMSRARMAFTMLSATRRLRYHLWSAGMICHGAHLVLQRSSTASYAFR